MINLTEMKAFRHEKWAREQWDKGRLPRQWLIFLLWTASFHENVPKYRERQNTYIWLWVCILPGVAGAPPQRQSLKKPAPRLERTHSQSASPPSFEKTKTRTNEFRKIIVRPKKFIPHNIFPFIYLLSSTEIFIDGFSTVGTFVPLGIENKPS